MHSKRTPIILIGISSLIITLLFVPIIRINYALPGKNEIGEDITVHFSKWNSIFLLLINSGLIYAIVIFVITILMNIAPLIIACFSLKKYDKALTKSACYALLGGISLFILSVFISFIIAPAM